MKGWRITQIQSTEGKRSVLWDITGTCNLRCKHCYQFDRYEYDKIGPYKKDLSSSEALAALERFIEAKFTHIHFLGGEPLLRQDLNILVETANKNGIYTSINTNGLLLSERKVEELTRAGINQIMVSLDGATPETNDSIRGKGTYNKILNNISRANLGLAERIKNPVITRILTIFCRNHVLRKLAVSPQKPCTWELA